MDWARKSPLRARAPPPCAAVRNTCKRAGSKHLLPSLKKVWLVDGVNYALLAHSNSLLGPDVTDWVTALITTSQQSMVYDSLCLYYTVIA